MNFKLRAIGLSGLAIIVLALSMDIWDFARQDQRESGTSLEGLAHLVPGLGIVETAFVGDIELTLQDSEFSPATGEIVFFTRLMVRGHDPVFQDRLMILPDAEITQYDRAGTRVVYRANTELAKIHLQPDSVGLQLDGSRPWQLQNPRIDLHLTDQTALLTTALLFLDAEAGKINTNETFSLSGSGFEIRGKSLKIDMPSRNFFFGGKGKHVSWTINNAATKNLWSGQADGPGSLRSSADKLVFELEGDSLCRVQTPGKDTIDSSALSIEFGNSLSAWVPRRGRFVGPCTILPGNKKQGISISSGDVVPQWDGGVFAGMELRGPLTVVFPDGSWASCDDGAWVGAEQEIQIWGGVVGELPNGSFRANNFTADQSGLYASGNVMFADGGGSCDELWHSPDGHTELSGRVALEQGDGMSIQADLVVISPESNLKAHGNVLALMQEEDGGVAKCRADEVDYFSDWRGTNVSAIEARGDVRFDRGDIRILGNSLRLIENTRAELEGWPAEAFLANDPHGARMVADKFLWEKDNIYPSGGPVLMVPAKYLGLRGETIRISSQRMRFNTADGSWQLLGDVMLGGALNGFAQKIVGSERLATMSPGSGDFCFLTGTLEGGEFFNLRAEQIEVINGRRVHLYRDARASLRPESGKVIHLRGREADFTRAGGWFQHNVELEVDEVTGSADRISWEYGEAGTNSFSLSGSASLQDSTVKIVGANISYDLQGMLVFVSGNEQVVATIEMADGRSATGTWLSLNIQDRLLAGANGVIKQDD